MANPATASGASGAAARANGQSATPADETCEPCKARFRVEAHYDDPWMTPIVDTPLRVRFREGGVIDAGGVTRSLATDGSEDGADITPLRADLGSHEGRADRPGYLEASLTPSPAGDPDAIAADIIEQLGGFATSMEVFLQPSIAEWEEDGWWGVFEDLWSGLKTGASAWWEGERDFWTALGEWADRVPDMLGDAWEALSDKAKALWDNRHRIIGLLRDLASGDVSAFEAGLEAVLALVRGIPDLADLQRVLTELVDKSAEWAGVMIELATRTTVLRVMGATVLGVLMLVPPNLWAEMAGMTAGFLLPEALIALVMAIIAYFTAGAGAAGLTLRIGMFTGKVAASLSKAGKAGEVLIKVFDFLTTLMGKMGDLVRALKGKIDDAAEGVTDQVTRIVRKTDKAPEAGSIRNVNPQGGRTNCVNCSIATDATLAGRPASALDGKPVSVRELETTFGRKFSQPATINQITNKMEELGHGHRGIVFGHRGPGKVGHAFNVVNQNGVVRYLDGQTGTVAKTDGFVSLHLLRTN